MDGEDTSDILCSVENGIQKIVLNRPKKMNALTTFVSIPVYNSVYIYNFSFKVGTPSNSSFINNEETERNLHKHHAPKTFALCRKYSCRNICRFRTFKECYFVY